MRFSLLFLFASALLLSAGCSSPAGEGTDENSPGDSAAYGTGALDELQAEFEAMKSVLTLEGDALASLESAHAGHLSALQSWYTENGPTITRIQQEALDAARDRDLARLNSMDASGDKETVKRLKEEEDKLLKEYLDAVEQSLSPDDFNKWQQHVICENVLTFLSDLNLTDEQVGQIRAAAPDALRRVPDPENWRGYGSAELEKAFEGSIVTEDQRTGLKELQDGNKMRMLKWSWGT